MYWYLAPHSPEFPGMLRGTAESSRNTGAEPRRWLIKDLDRGCEVTEIFPQTVSRHKALERRARNRCDAGVSSSQYTAAPCGPCVE